MLGEKKTRFSFETPGANRIFPLKKENVVVFNV